MKSALLPEMSRLNHLISIYYVCKQALILVPNRTNGQISAQIPMCCRAYQCGSTVNKLPKAKARAIQTTEEIIYMFCTFSLSFPSAMQNIIRKKSAFSYFPIFISTSVFREETKTTMLAESVYQILISFWMQYSATPHSIKAVHDILGYQNVRYH